MTPGAIETDMTRDIVDKLVAGVPAGCVGHPDGSPRAVQRRAQFARRKEMSKEDVQFVVTLLLAIVALMIGVAGLVLGAISLVV